MSTTRDQRVHAMWRAMKRRGAFHYDEFGQSPYLHLARAFKMPITQVRGILTEERRRRAEARGE